MTEPTDRDYSNCVVVITGGASGIGRSLAFAFAREGAGADSSGDAATNIRIVIADLEPEPAEQVATELNAQGAQAIAVACDISLESDVERLAAETLGQFGGVNVLCNIAGVHVLRKLHETAALDVEWIFAVNVFGLCHMARHFVPQLKAAAKRGETAQMINASSGFGVGVPAMGPTSPSAYTGTKHAIVGLSDAMRNELEPDGIGVSVVCPSLVNTQTWNSTSFRQQRFGGPVPGTPESKATVETWGQDPDETAAMIIERAKRGDFFILPHNEAARKTMQTVIDQRYEELAAALRYGSGDN